ncbi:MAG: hypothetical protein WEG36_00280 [Gemmatimonadota bacterium]
MTALRLAPSRHAALSLAIIIPKFVRSAPTTVGTAGRFLPTPRMPDDPDLRNRALELEIQARTTLTQLAIAPDGAMAEELSALDHKLEELDRLRIESEGRLRWPPDAAQRLAVCRLETRKLREGKTRRRDAVGKIRLLIPRFGGETSDRK